MTYKVYILRCKNGSLYTGITTDIERRLEEHNGVRPGGAKYTRVVRPVVLVYTEEVATRSEALKREHVLKQMSHGAKESLVKGKSNA
jgi:putative endonuclease